MRNRVFTLIIFFTFSGLVGAQAPLLKEIGRCRPKYEKKIKKLVVKEFKVLSQKYNQVLLLPFLYLNHIELTQALMTSDRVEETVMNALKSHPTVDNLRTSANFPHHAIIYDANLRVLDNYDGYFCVTPPHAEALVKCYKEINPQLLFYIWGLNDLFVLIDNRIYQLAYNQTDDTFSKVEL